MILGRIDKLHFEINLSSQRKHLGAGSLRAGLGESQIWGSKTGRGIDWTWIDLLEQLARSWPFLRYEESAPPGLYDVTLSLLRHGHPTTRDLDFEPVTEVSRETYVFLRRHNLATGIEGLYLPSFSLLREGRKMWVASTHIARLMDLSDTLHTLTELGNVLSESISSATPDDRARLAVAAWHNREPSAAAAIEIKVGSAQLALVPQDQTVASYFEVTRDGEYESPLLLAARMSAAVPLENRRTILEFVRGVAGVGISEELEGISAEAQNALPTYSMPPHKQGEALARWARNRFGLQPNVKADPEAILQGLGVKVSQHHFGVDMVDAIGCWSDTHGPGVIVNLDGIHAHAAPGRRATLAHELAHILVDRHGSLPAAEVLGDAAPLYPEQRASAFAAEFLLPKAVAAERFRDPISVELAINTLQREFEVSRELAAWQVINGPSFHQLSSRDQQLLKRWTADSPYPRLF
jgi:Zn-dependent peptidase ImmA (M78 family)